MSRTEQANILIVDDLPEKLLVVGTILEDLGENLVFVRSGTDALREVLKREFAVILLDVNMPDIDGFETASLIRQYKPSAHTPIIFITAYADEMQTSRGYSLGAVDYILSPVIPDVLRSKVKVFVELHMLQRKIRQQAEERVALSTAEAARQVAEENTRRSNFLSHASRLLSGSLDLNVGMRSLLELLVPEISNFAALAMVNDRGALDEAMVCRAVESSEGPNVTLCTFVELPAPMCEVMRDTLDSKGRTVLLTDELAGFDVDADVPIGTHAAVLKTGVALALIIGEHVLGVLVVASETRSSDWAALEELASRAAIAFENARLYRSLQSEIVERRHAEIKLLESNQRKDEFLAMLSHELRNPLAPIRNAAEVLRRLGPADPKFTWASGVMDRQIHQLTRLVEELLDVARINQGKIVLQSESLDLAHVIAHSVETARPLIDARRQTLVLKLADTPVWLRGDFPRLSQVVGNLLNNASKYTQEGGAIELSMRVDGGEAVICIRDNGIGIESELLPHVFELFEQGKRSLDRSQGGLGVGLTLVKRLVHLHQGRVEVSSLGAGEGAEFRVYLPCVSQVPIAELMSASDAFSQPLTAYRILIVDDNRDAAESVAMFLEMEGYEVKTVGDGMQALACSPAFAPHVVLLDIGLPVLSGYEVAERLRLLPQTCDSLLIALTGYGQKEDEAKALKAGCNRHFVKPANPRDLVDFITAWRPVAERGQRS